MEQIITVVLFAFGDGIALLGIHTALLLAFIHAILRDNGLLGRHGGIVTRGDRSRSYFYIVYGVISVILIHVIGVADAAHGYKVSISIADLIILIRLVFFSGWFQNQITGLLAKSMSGKPT